MEREVRYCTSHDGTRIAYSVAGEGPPLLICPGGFDSFDNEPTTNEKYLPAWQGRTNVRYDFRGIGLSQRDAPAYDLDCMTFDIEAVVQSAGFDRIAIWASAFSVSPAIAFAVKHPETVTRIALLRVITRATDLMPRENLDAIVQLVRSNWDMATQMLADLGVRDHPDAGANYVQMIRSNARPESVAQLLAELYATVDVREMLRDVACPTLLVHRRNDTIFPFPAAQEAAAEIPQARLITLSGSGQISVGDDADQGVKGITEFLDEDPATRAVPTVEEPTTGDVGAFRTIVFTDLVGHTEMMARLGDERGREVLREHERITREVLKAHGGTEVKTMGDGFMASFGSVTKAVECAIALQRAFADREGEPLSVRVGLNAGEPIEEDGDLFGATVILASRIAAKTDGGEILVSDNVRSLAAGKGFLFSDRGEFAAKGFEEPVRVYEVSWRA